MNTYNQNTEKSNKIELEEINTQQDFSRKIVKTTNDPGGKNMLRLTNSIINIEIRNIIDFDFIDCRNCVFNKPVSFSNITFIHDSYFINCEFKDKLNFENAIFESKARFYGTSFSIVNFNNTVFKDLADFWGTVFKKDLIFYKTDFLGTTVFSTAKFKENVLYTYTLIENSAIFRGTNFRKGVDFSLAIIQGRLNLFDIKITDFECKKDSEDEKQYETYVSEEAIITMKNKRETFRILKNTLISQGNKIDSLRFSIIEQNTFKKQLFNSLINKDHKFPIQDYIILFTNYLSNNHGRSYVRAIFFTLGISFIFFYLSLLATENFYFSFEGISLEGLKKSVRYYFIFLNPTHNIKFLDAESPTTLFYISDFLGRIFTSYGIYQTIQAFRKYKK